MVVDIYCIFYAYNNVLALVTARHAHLRDSTKLLPCKRSNQV